MKTKIFVRLLTLSISTMLVIPAPAWGNPTTLRSLMGSARQEYSSLRTRYELKGGHVFAEIYEAKGSEAQTIASKFEGLSSLPAGELTEQGGLGFRLDGQTLTVSPVDGESVLLDFNGREAVFQSSGQFQKDWDALAKWMSGSSASSSWLRQMGDALVPSAHAGWPTTLALVVAGIAAAWAIKKWVAPTVSKWFKKGKKKAGELVDDAKDKVKDAKHKAKDLKEKIAGESSETTSGSHKK